ncbi:hypothetical protein DB321_09145 [Ligilactobacillus salivarius]|uniref:Uncharacterized protein n=2 Tax=Ligilactobacillus salivarius TaxID=1624 RepID=A0A6A8LX13_9LACO|nr:hypothetical protein [Ligilactobacillus salivarius]ATP38499.1 hypothetical protein CR531_10180 [Ligilactobacillus salivarius]EEJ73527.1 hypothetical protein HMPREF0545_1566 [Ligilactobacillus salivarius DSM 20555 = ATCC 11741]MBE7938879.1 hypothetical protein [Ligilactobacillus salivarius]MDG9755715.1 hypothetical protein [Ligilactobacillus salivarius]MDQ4443496.1 hypothetical protein [Ligilactobacillus salivarius]
MTRKLLKQVSIKFYDNPEDKLLLEYLVQPHINQTNLLKSLLKQHIAGNKFSPEKRQIVDVLTDDRDNEKIEFKTESKKVKELPKKKFKGGFKGFIS